MSHLIIVTNIIGVVNHQTVDYFHPKRQASSSLIQEYTYFILESAAICMIAPPYTNLFLSQGQQPLKWLSPSILSFLLQPIHFPSTFHFSKIWFLLQNTTSELFDLSLSLSVVKVPIKLYIIFSSLYVVISFVLLRHLCHTWF